MYVVYCHTNRVSKKSYVGYTHYTMTQRWKRGHLASAARHKRFALSHAIRKYGPDTWDHIELEHHSCLKEAQDAEEFFIAYLQTLTPNGYNMIVGGRSRKPSDDEKRQLQEKTRKAMHRPDVRTRHLAAQANPNTRKRKSVSVAASWRNHIVRENHRIGYASSTKVKRHAVEQLERETLQHVTTFVSVSEASRSTGIHKSSILNHLRGNQKHSGGFIWRYACTTPHLPALSVPQ